MEKFWLVLIKLITVNRTESLFFSVFFFFFLKLLVSIQDISLKHYTIGISEDMFLNPRTTKLFSRVLTVLNSVSLSSVPHTTR